MIKQIIEKLKTSKLIMQIIKFGGVGIINTALDFAIMWILLLYLKSTFEGADILTPFQTFMASSYYMVAQTVSFFCGATCSYFLNKYWTFGASAKRGKQAIIKMYIVSGISFGLTQFGLWLLIGNMGMRPEMLAKLIITPLIMVINFLGSKFWVFRETPLNSQ